MSAPKSAATKARKRTGSVSSASDFKRRAKGQPLPLPSGLVVRARRVSIDEFILTGNVPNPLMEVVSEALEKGRKADVTKMVGVEEGKLDLDMVNSMFQMVEAVVMASVIEPKIHPVPTMDDVYEWNQTHPDEGVKDPEDLRDDDLVYVDEVGAEDKMFIFQWNTGGTDDVARFRQEASSDLATLAEGESSSDQTE